MTRALHVLTPSLTRMRDGARDVRHRRPIRPCCDHVATSAPTPALRERVGVRVLETAPC